MRLRLRPGLLRWAVSVYCALIGALMLTVPHQFAGASFGPLRPWLALWGAAFFAAGAGLVMVSAIGMRGPLALVARASVGVALLVLSLSFLLTGGWTGVVVYGVFGLATILSIGQDQSGSPDEQGLDLFVLTAALAAIGNGAVLALAPSLSMGPIYDPVRAALPSYSTLFLAGGITVLLAKLVPHTPGWVRSAARILLAVAFMVWCFGSARPLRIWTGILFYGGVGMVLVFGPVLAPRLRHLDAGSLRVRLALAMASAAAIPLLVVMAVATGWQEQSATEQQLALQQALASGLAADVDGALTQHLVGLVLVAENPAVLSRSAPGVSTTQVRPDDVAPGLLALGTFDGAGRPVVVPSGNDPETQVRLSTMASETLRRAAGSASGRMTPTAFLHAGTSPGDATAIVLAAPARLPGGRLGGIAVGELDRAWLQERLERGVGGAHLAAAVIDDAGRVVVAAGEPIVAPQRLGSHPAVVALHRGGVARGAVRYWAGPGEYLAGYARVPEASWTVVVEQPTSGALASVWVSRELTFGVLMAAFVVASALGVALADRLAAPLALLARAAQAVAVGAPASMLPRSRIYEVRVVARAFARMQARLATRTAERERAEARLRTLAHASGELTHTLDETAVVDALGRIAATELADWCTVTTSDEGGQPVHALIRHRDPARHALATHIGELPPFFHAPIRPGANPTEPVLMPVVTPRQIEEIAGSAEQRRVIEWLGVRSLMAVPLRVRDRTLGVLTCVYGRGSRRYTAEDLALAEDLAARAALGIDNARLYAAERTARSEAEAAVRVRDEFLAVAAHELKTPVTSLRGFAELGVRALDKHGTLDPPLARRTLETIERQSGRLSALVANLLEVARSSAAHDTIAPRPIDLVELVRAVVDAAQVHASSRRIALEAPEQVDVVADPLRIDQVLTNLVDNAVKYSPDGSPIDVCVVAGPEHAEVVVRDYGIGIPREHQHRIFDRFFQAHTDEHASGMGLGLHISRQIIQRHGGTIHAEMPEDGGTRMVVRLPRAGPVVD